MEKNARLNIENKRGGRESPIMEKIISDLVHKSLKKTTTSGIEIVHSIGGSRCRPGFNVEVTL